MNRNPETIMNRRRPSSSHGYALIGLLIVVLIVGLLATFSLPSKKALPDRDFPPPETVVQEYYALFIEGDIPGAAEMLWMTQGEKRYMRPLLMERLYEKHGRLRMQGGGLKSVQTESLEQQDDTARIEVEETLDNGEKNTLTLSLRKGEEGWKILLR